MQARVESVEENDGTQTHLVKYGDRIIYGCAVNKDRCEFYCKAFNKGLRIAMKGGLIMDSTKELIGKMEEQDREKFLSALDKRRPKFIEYNTKFMGISDMIESAFNWRNTEEGFDFWDNMAYKYKHKED